MLCISHAFRRAAFLVRTAGFINHAEYELRRAGLFDKDSDYAGATGKAVMDLVKVFAGQGHSGASAELTLEIFDRVARYDVLTPVTSDPGEWEDVSPYGSRDAPPMWQNKRKLSLFSNDGGKTWWDVDKR